MHARAAEGGDNLSLATLARPALLAGALGAALLVVALIGSDLGPGAALGSLVLKLGAFWPALLYLAAAFGLGAPLRPLWRGADDPIAIQAAAGLALMLSLSHLLGVLGALGPVGAIAPVALGLALLVPQARDLRRHLGRADADARPRLWPAWMLLAPGAGVLLVAAASPPGWLWASEFGGYDALSYHLQLPQEWLRGGRIAPVEHNVYSFLPGYVEAAFAHLGAMTLAPRPDGLLAGDGWRLIACHALHAGITLVAAWLSGTLARRLAIRAGLRPRGVAMAGLVGAGVALTTPWAVVAGSLAYNEGAVNALLAGALLVCAQPGLSPGRRGVLVGALVGVACGCKPTALFFAGAPAALGLLAGVGPEGRRRLARAIALGALAGGIALAPWLVRNAMHVGNPVFPFASELFGTSHWSAEQAERYAAAHRFDGSAADRLRTLVWTSPAAAPGDPPVVRFRGLANPQWGLMGLFALGGLGLLLASGGGPRRVGALLGVAAGLQVLAWLALTHLQSRFLLPVLPVGAALAGVAVGRLRDLAADRPDAAGGVGVLAGAVVLSQAGFLLGIYASERQGSPGVGLALWPVVFTGVLDEEPDASAAGWLNTRPEDGSLVYLLGDATPLYFGPGVVYHTTYDTSPLGALVEAHPGDPGAWASGLRDLGVAWVLVSESELSRLHASGWYDPRVTAGVVGRLTEHLGGPVRVWPRERRYVLALREERIAQ
jgi:hypothetical protein